MKKVHLLYILFLIPSLGLSQSTTKIYFIQKFNPKEIFEYPNQYSPDIKIKSAGIELYQSKENQKVDSMFRIIDDFHIWNDSISFSVNVPNHFFTNGSILIISPIFYLGNSVLKGGAPNYILGKEQVINQILLKIKSNPSGATIYLIPKLYWDRNKQLSKFNLKELSHYLVSEGTTTVYHYVQEYVYVAVFLYKNKFVTLECSPNLQNPIDSIYKKL